MQQLKKQKKNSELQSIFQCRCFKSFIQTFSLKIHFYFTYIDVIYKYFPKKIKMVITFLNIITLKI